MHERVMATGLTEWYVRSGHFCITIPSVNGSYGYAQRAMRPYINQWMTSGFHLIMDTLKFRLGHTA